jgi:hypothetical protein
MWRLKGVKIMQVVLSAMGMTPMHLFEAFKVELCTKHKLQK